MGRELRRVPLDFDWPLNEIWDGFVNQWCSYSGKCQECNGSGYAAYAFIKKEQWYGSAPFKPEDTGSTPFKPDHPIIRAQVERKVQANPEFYSAWHESPFDVFVHNAKGSVDWLATAIEREVHRMCGLFNTAWMHHLDQADVDALIAQGRLWDLTRDGHHPSAQEVNEWSLTGLGHDSLNMHICVKARCERIGISVNCPDCGGSGEVWDSPEAKERYDAWKPTDPPTGPGYQVWETVSEGSPISPVFETEDQLIDWLIGQGYSEGAAEQFTKEGWAPTLMVSVDPDGQATHYKDIESLNAARDGDD